MADATFLKNVKCDISAAVSDLDITLHGALDFALGLTDLIAWTADDADLKQNFSNKTPDIHGKIFSVYNHVWATES